MNKVTVMGFDNTPYSVIFWEKQEVSDYKTICYSGEEEMNALVRYYTPKDFYYESFDNYQIKPLRAKERKWA